MDTNWSFAAEASSNNHACDSYFWPASAGCSLSRFDFSLLFEQTILSLVPSTLLVLCAIPRVAHLYRENRKVSGRLVPGVKLAACVTYLALRLVILIAWAQNNDKLANRFTFAAAAFGVVDGLVLFVLSYLEHYRTVRPSTIVSVYLLFSLLFDIAQCRTLWLLSDLHHTPAPTFTAALVVKAVIFVLELQSKRASLFTTWKRLTPEDTSGVVNRGVFWWLNTLLLHGFQASLSLVNLYDIDHQLSSEALAGRLTSAWHHVQLKSHPRLRRYRLILSVFYALRGPIAAAVAPRLLLIGFSFSQPFLIKRVIRLVAEIHSGNGRSDETDNVGWALILATGLVYLGTAICTGFHQHKLFRSLTMVRGCLVSVISTQSLTLDAPTASSSGTAVLTLTGPDIMGICRAFESLHEIWANPIEIGIAIWLLERELGPGSVGPAISVIVCTVLMTQLSKHMGPAMKAWNDAIQRRVTTTSNVIGYMKEVKMLGMVDQWRSSIQNLRVQEVELSKAFRKFIVWMNVLGNAPGMLTPILTFGIAVAIYNSDPEGKLTVEAIFASLTIFSVLLPSLAQLLSAMPMFVSSVGCFERIQTFLEKTQDAQGHFKPIGQDSTVLDGSSDTVSGQVNVPMQTFRETRSGFSGSTPMISIKDASFSLAAGEDPILTNITISAQPSSVTALIGKVGSGKTILLLGMLGELHAQGHVSLSSHAAAYCSQSPWLIHGTIRENIVGPASVEIDERWYRTVTQACALERDFEQLPDGDGSAVGSRGITLSGGQKHRVALARALYSRKRLLLVDDILSGLDATTRGHIWDRVFGRSGLCRQMGITVIIATHTVSLLEGVDNIVILEDGRVKRQGTFDDLRDQGYVANRVAASIANSSSDDTDEKSPSERSKTARKKAIAEENEIDDLTRRSGDTTLYVYYAKSIGWKLGLAGLSSGIVTAFFHMFSDIWLKWWGEANSSGADVDNGRYLGILSFLLIAGLVFNGADIWLMFVKILPKSAQALHWTLLRTVMSAPMSFFTSTDNGDLINRFSQDMSLIDRELPTAVFTTYTGLLGCIANAILVFIGARYLAAAMPVMVFLLYMLQKFYLRTSRQLRLLDLQAKAPLYKHLGEMVEGLLTIRAFRWQPAMRDSALQLLDRSQQPHYLLYSVQRWLTLVLDMFVAASAVLLVTLAVKTNGSTAGNIGLAMYSIIGFSTGLTQLISSWTQLETSLGAISRLRSFESTTPREPRDETGTVPPPPLVWPSQGNIRVTDVTATYSSVKGAEPVLKAISLDFKPGQKIAICGRTGSGKSTFLSTLFRLMEYSGSIKIDGLDISDVSHEALRSRLITVPQEPVLFEGTLRSNLTAEDPAAKTALDRTPPATDAQIESILDRLEMWSTISLHGGLDVDMANLSLSHGQKQLICLARAILRKHVGRVVVLDEAMSSVDQHTEELMVRALETEFPDHTVVSVAHRLKTVRGYDKLVVLDQGRVVRMGRPCEMLTEDFHLKE